MEKSEPSYIVCGNVNWHSYYGKQYKDSLKKTKSRNNNDPEILFLGIHLEKTIIQKRHRNPNIHWSPIYNNQDMEAT